MILMKVKRKTGLALRSFGPVCCGERESHGEVSCFLSIHVPKEELQRKDASDDAENRQQPGEGIAWAQKGLVGEEV